MNEEKYNIPYNDKCQRHGYAIYYYSNGNVMYEGNFINGKHIGVFKFYDRDGLHTSKTYHI